jgi:methyltransferase
MIPDPYAPNAAAITVLALVTAQRCTELIYARRNETRLRAQGGEEYGAGHYRWIVALHAAWLAGLWLLAVGIPPQPAWLLGYLVLQILRGWVLMTLGPRWTTRIIVVPGAPLVDTGPYRVLSHPNYVVVAAEIFVLPMVFGLWLYAVIFSVLNAAVLLVRIRVENEALREAQRPRRHLA